jgi:glutaminyl-tRNA synthetase
VKWLGCSWEQAGETNLYQASNYFDWMARSPNT